MTLGIILSILHLIACFTQCDYVLADLGCMRFTQVHLSYACEDPLASIPVLQLKLKS